MHLIFQAHGKLLLTAEYFVLDGAWALATPVRLGQTLECEASSEEMVKFPEIHWRSFDVGGKCWLEAIFDAATLEERYSSDASSSAILQKILREARNMNPGFLTNTPALEVRTRLEFPNDWGLGSSSTLIYNIARWAGVDPFALQFRTLGGSGYDIACAGAGTALLYRLQSAEPEVQPCHFHPPFAGSLFFVFLGKKQNSREGIARYREKRSSDTRLIESVSRLTQEFLTATTLSALEEVIIRHEKLVAEALDLPRAKDLYFSDYWGEIKSLGAWGGDFALVTNHRSPEDARRYFNEKGYGVFLAYEELALSPCK